MRAVVLNLDRSRDRLAWFMNQAAAQGLTVERLPGIDAGDPAMRPLIETWQSHRDPPLAPGDIACLLGHRRAWQSLLDGDESWLAVFEDDVHMAPGVAAFLDEAWIPPDARLVKLETIAYPTIIGRRPRARVGDRAVVRLLYGHLGSAAYLVSRAAAQELLAVSEVAYETVDAILFREFLGRIPVLQALPAPCIQDHLLAELEMREVVLQSTIAGQRVPWERPRQPPIRKVLRKIRRYGAKLARAAALVREGASPFPERQRVPFG